MNVLVFGASGYIGTHLVEVLRSRGHAVRASARNRDAIEARAWEGVEIVAADALSAESLAPALEGIDAAYYLVHSMGGGKGFAIRDRKAAANFRRAAEAASVGRIIYLGGLIPPGAPSEHLASRQETGDVLRAGSVPVTELRAGLIVGPGSAGFEVLRDLVNHLPIMVAPKWTASLTQPIALGDLLEYLAGLLDHPETAGREYDVIGPERLSYRDLIARFARVTGKCRLVIPVPVLTTTLSSYWLDLVTSVPASVARPLVHGLKTDLIGDDRPIRAILAVPQHTYEEAVRIALERERDQAVPARWTEGAIAFRGYNPDVSFYSKGEVTEHEVSAPAEAAWDVVRRIGGHRGYYHADFLWALRGFMDRAIGGVGMRRGRRHPFAVRVGDAIDFWRVVAVEQGQQLTLVAEMKLPGVAVLEFTITEVDETHSRLRTTARFHPSGIWGLLYWYSVAPFHGFIFDRMPRNMARAAEESWRASESARA